ncbi:MAG: hypothetical protein ACRD5G_04780 [Candidatus Acidiferrales bacterium]
MRLAFVIRLGNETRPADGFFEGWIEEVDTCTERRFRSTEELLKFLGQRFDLATATPEKAEGNNRGEQSSPKKKGFRKERKSS